MVYVAVHVIRNDVWWQLQQQSDLNIHVHGVMSRPSGSERTQVQCNYVRAEIVQIMSNMQKDYSEFAPVSP